MMKPATLKKQNCHLLLLAASLLCVGNTKPAHAQAENIDYTALVRETQQMLHTPGRLILVWWAPLEFWRLAAQQNPKVSASEAEEFSNVLRPYTIVMVVEAKTGTFGHNTYTTEADLSRLVRVKDASATVYTPLAQSQINGETQAILGLMKPTFANMMGPFGENLHFFVFPAQDKGGRSISDATKDGVFYAEVGDKEFRWRLPLGSLLAPKICPVCKEKLSGAYKYCPWDATKLPDT